jgi:DNA-binding PadR family transcriptional regulator
MLWSLTYVFYICEEPVLRGGPRARRHHRGRWHVHARVERFAEPAVLLLLREGRAYGSELLDRLPEVTGEQRVEMGNLYRLLRALEEEGLVTSEWVHGKRIYALAEPGARLLDEWVEALRRARERTDAFIRRYEERR